MTTRGSPLRLAWTFFRIGAMNELQYRVNFFLQLVQSLIAVGTALVVLALVFSYTDSLGGWSSDELLVVMSVHVLIGGVIRTAIQPAMLRLIEDIRQGTLDYALTKPEDGQLLVSIREFRIWQSVDLLVGTALLTVALIRLGGFGGVLGLLGFAAALALGAVMIYSCWLALATSAFWIVRMDFIADLFDGLYQAGRWPVTIYPGWLRGAFTFLVPLAFAVTVPAQALTGRLTAGTLVGAAVFAFALAVGSRLLWRRGLRQYSGASA